MSLKTWIRKKIIERQLNEEKKGSYVSLELPGDPLIFSIRYQVGKRRFDKKYFRNLQWRSIIKCYFRSYWKKQSPVVVIVRFYVAPPSSVTVKHNDLKKENTPAVEAYELCDYFLSFVEMIRHNLIITYRQIVKIEMDKFYSNNPRTVFQFMTWSDYANLQSDHSPHTQSKKYRAIQPEPFLQPLEGWDAQNPNVRAETIT